MKLLKSHKQLEQLLSHEMYELEIADKVGSYLEPLLESVNSDYMHEDSYNIFDDLLEEIGRPPSQNEYVSEYIRLAKIQTLDNAEAVRARGNKLDSNIHAISKHNRALWIPWNDIVSNYMKIRASRTYASHIAEYSAIHQLKDIYPRANILSHSKMDTGLGVDIVAIFPDKNRLLYFHITSHTVKPKHKPNWRDSRDSVRGKASRGRNVSGVYQKGTHRGFDGNLTTLDGVKHRIGNPAHQILTYSLPGSFFDNTSRSLLEGNMRINGNTLYTRDFIENIVEASLNGEVAEGSRYYKQRMSTRTAEENREFMEKHENLEENELRAFADWCNEKYNIDNSLSQMTIYIQGRADIIGQSVIKQEEGVTV